jgi:ATP-dependent helicase HrpB
VLPIEPILPAIADAIARGPSLVVQAPPGAGKTTTVPLALLDSDWLEGRSIVMLEPRRLATRAAAFRLAELHGDSVGETVGYRMRGDTRVGRRTRIEVVTEGILTRRLQNDPTLDDVGLLIFDEFHERSLDADLGLALALRTRALLREDLRIIAMSATLDGAAVARVLGDAPIITSEGRAFPVETRHVAPRPNTRPEATVLVAIDRALADDDGDLLVFLPGAAEISRVASALDQRLPGNIVVRALLGALSQHDQDVAIRPDAHGRRKIVLATSIAETSLTIEGIRVVVDSGWSRRPRFSPATGMTRLETVRVSLAAANQRRGRAGRLGPGVCYRCWPEHETPTLLAAAPPEIASADLGPLALSLAAAGVDDPTELSWIDPPAPAAFAQARELLRELGAIDANGALTRAGRAMADVPLHPRLSHMLMAAGAGSRRVAAALAALLSERDVFRAAAGPIDADVEMRVDLILRSEDSGALPAGAEVDRDALRRARAEVDRLSRSAAAANEQARNLGVEPSLGYLLSLAYPDRVAQRRPGDAPRFVLRNGRGAEMLGPQSLANEAYIVAAELDDRRPNGRIFLGAALSLDEIRAAFGDQIVVEDVVEIDEQDVIVARRRERLGAIALREVALGDADPDRVRDAIIDAIRRRGIDRLAWSDSARRLRERIAFLHRHDPSWPDVSDSALTDSLEEWLAPHATAIKRLAQIDVARALTELLDWQQRRALDELAPTHVEVPTGSRIPVDYTDPDAPVLAVRLQEVFGLTESPRLLGGRVPLTMHLLSPAHRPVQVTRDLAGFWRTSYFDVRKDLRGRYPKHEWPEDPLAATPTKRAKPRK